MRYLALSTFALPLWISSIGAVSGDSNCTTITDILCDNDGEYPTDTFCELIQMAGVQDDLDAEEWTVFAPTNDAISALPSDVLDALVTDLGLMDVVAFHLVPGMTLESTDLKCDGRLLMLNEEYSVSICEGDRVYQVGIGNPIVSYPEITVLDIKACNGVIHLISDIMLYENVESNFTATDNSTEKVVTSAPTNGPTTEAPSVSPSNGPTTQTPSESPSESPSETPSGSPSGSPTESPSGTPSESPSESPSGTPTGSPTGTPSESPTGTPTGPPSNGPFNPLPTPGSTTEITSAPTPVPETPLGVSNDEESAPEACTITEIACTSSDFNYLCSALRATGLSEVFDDDNGNYTIFAPNDAAFEALGDDAIAYLMDSDNVDLLAELLSFHTIEDNVVYSEDLECRETIEMANGKDSRTVCRKDGIFQKGKGNSDDHPPAVIEADIESCSGVIHVIDDVMLFDYPEELGILSQNGTFDGTVPPTSTSTSTGTSTGTIRTTIATTSSTSAVIDTIDVVAPMREIIWGPPDPVPASTTNCKSIEQVVCDNPDFSILCGSLKEANLVGALATGTWTLFAPNNQAFLKLPPDFVNALNTDNDVLTQLLLFHAVSEQILTKDDLPCTAGENLVPMANGKDSRTLCDDIRPGVPVPKWQKGRFNPRNEEAEFQAFDMHACNGVVHEIGGVLLYRQIE